MAIQNLGALRSVCKPITRQPDPSISLPSFELFIYLVLLITVYISTILVYLQTNSHFSE